MIGFSLKLMKNMIISLLKENLVTISVEMKLDALKYDNSLKDKSSSEFQQKEKEFCVKVGFQS